MDNARIYIVEDSSIIRENLIEALHENAPVEVVGTADDEKSAVAWLRDRSHASDLVIVDIFLKSGSGLGVVDIKATEIESADAVARAIERAEQMLGAGRVRYIHPDCGFWMLKRPIADAKIRALARGRDLYEGRTH